MIDSTTVCQHYNAGQRSPSLKTAHLKNCYNYQMHILSRKECLLVPLLALALYLPCLQFDFAYDDLLVITHNPLITQSTEMGLKHVLTLLKSATPPGDLYRPLPALTYWFDYLISGGAPGLFHGINLLFYALLCLLVWKLFDKALFSRPAAFWGTLLFVVHPIHVEPVANVVGRAELLAAIFGIAGLLPLWRDRPEQIQWKSSFFSALLMGFALLSKESAFTFLPLYAFVLYLKHQKLRLLIPHLLIAAIALLFRKLALGSGFLVAPESSAMNPENPLLALPFSSRLLPALKTLGDYLQSLIAPVDLSPDYSILPATLFEQTFSMYGVLTLVLLGSFLTLACRSSSPAGKFFGFWFLISFLLTANIILPIGTIRADRLALVPGIGVIGLCIETLGRKWPNRVTPVGLLLCLTFMLQTIRLVPIWQNNGTLFRYMAATNPENPKALYNYGIYLYTHDHDAAEATRYLRKTLELVPDHLYSMKTLADLALAREDYPEVAYWYNRILENYPEEQQVRRQLEQIRSAVRQR